MSQQPGQTLDRARLASLSQRFCISSMRLKARSLSPATSSNVGCEDMAFGPSGVCAPVPGCALAAERAAGASRLLATAVVRACAVAIRVEVRGPEVSFEVEAQAPKTRLAARSPRCGSIRMMEILMACLVAKAAPGRHDRSIMFLMRGVGCASQPLANHTSRIALHRSGYTSYWSFPSVLSLAALRPTTALHVS